jgi:hypothetical protein
MMPRTDNTLDKTKPLRKPSFDFMYNENEIEYDERDSGNAFRNWMMGLFIAAIIGLSFLIVNNWNTLVARLKSPPTAKLHDYLIASNSAVYWYVLSQRLMEQTKEQHRFIWDTHQHVARFFTNEHISELEIAPARVSTFLDTNITRVNAFRVQVTPTNIIARKAIGYGGDRLDLQDRLEFETQ